MRKTRTALLAVATSAVTLFAGGTAAVASSHREAPFLTENPKVDATDFYMFRSYETGRDAYVTLIANYIPLQDPYGGPNFFSMDPDALYEIHIDNNHDAVEDITFQFRFQVAFKNISLTVGTGTTSAMNSVPLFNIGTIPGMASNDQNQNVTESYSVTVVNGPRRTGTAMAATNSAAGPSFTKPADLVGEKTSPDYARYAETFIHEINIPGCPTAGKVFVGQRKDPFVVNLGQIFDLLNIEISDASGGTMCDTSQPSRNILGGKNVTAIALEVPIACLKSATDPVIGAWTTASLRQARVLNRAPTFELPTKEGGAWAQVSRLGHPLVNEVVIGLKDKNLFNASEPRQDASLFLNYVQYPTLPKIVGIVYMMAATVNLEPQVFPRNDLVGAFLTGIDGLTKPTTAGATPSEQLRLNTGVPVTPAATQNTAGVLGGDTAGFPNGRRPVDDVVDIELRAAMGRLLRAMDPRVPAQGYDITDCAPTSAGDYDEVFPYLKPPVPGSRVPVGT